MQIYEPPEKKCQLVLKAKSEYKAQIKRHMKNRKKKLIEKIEEQKEKERKKHENEPPKKTKLQEIFELYTNTVTIIEDKTREKRKIMNKMTEEDIKLEKLQEGIDGIDDKFLTKEEIIDLRKSYNDLSMGDYVIVFPNPDILPTNKAISLDEALSIYDNFLNVITDDPIMTKEEVNTQREAFIKAFLSLKDYSTKDQEYDDLKKIEENNKNLKNKNPKNDNKANKANKKLEQDVFNEKKGDNSSKKLQLEGNFVSLSSMTIMTQKKKIREAEEMKELIRKINSEREVTNTKDLSFFSKLDTNQLSKFSKIKKNYALGGFLIAEAVADSQDIDWICTNKPPADFLTLVRNVIQTKLVRNAMMHVRSFVTTTGQKIILVLKSDDEMIKREAEASFMDKQIELGASDLFSLEPVDAKGRPLRMKAYVRKAEFPKDMEEIPDIEKEDRENGVSVSSRAQSLFQKIMKMSDLQLQRLVVNKQVRVDQCMSKLAKHLNIDLKNKGDLLEDDNSMTRETWETYYIYMAYLEELFTKLEKEQNKPEIKENQFFLYKLIFLKSVGDANEVSYMFYRNSCLEFCGLESDKKKDRLFTIWKLLGTDPIPPFMKYTEVGGSKWRSYEKNERGQRSKFLNMERLKMVNKIIAKHLNIIKLVRLKIVDSCFPLHDFYQLDGEFNTPLFKKLYDYKFLLEYKETDGEKRVKQYFVMMADEAEKTDFDTDGSSLADDIAFNCSKPWEINIESLRNYFGEKIAMYFNFLSFYTLYLMPMAFIGIVAQIVEDYASLMVSNGMKMAFSVLIIIWSTIFIELWKRKQSLFAVQFGQINTELAEAERPAFKGSFIRSVENDDINVLHFSPQRKVFRIIISYCISISILLCVITCVILILVFKSYFYGLDSVDTSNSLVAAVPSIINAIQIQIFNAIYQNVALKLNEYENHKLLSLYENSLVFKIFAFTFVNTFNSLVIISFMSSLFPDLNICLNSTTGVDDCFAAVATQMQTLFLTAFFKNLPELGVPYIKLYMLNKNKKKTDKPIEHPFYQIDLKIEDQIDKTPYAANLEVDGTAEDYMELVIQFGFLCLFAVNFPISYLLAFITNIAEIQVDKLKIVRFKRRPVPENAKDLGTWFLIIDFISFLAIFFNAALIAYTSSCIYQQDDNTKNKVFVVFVFFFLAAKYLIKILIPDVPYKSKMVELRHQFIKNRVELGFAGKNSNKMKSAKIQLSIEGLSNYQLKMKQDDLFDENKSFLSDHLKNEKGNKVVNGNDSKIQMGNKK